MRSSARPWLVALAALCVVAAGIGIGLAVTGGPGTAAGGEHGAAAPTTSSTGASPSSRTSAPGAAGPTSTSAPTTGVTSNSPSTGATSTATPPHVMLLVLENHSASQIVGSPTAPYLNRLVHRYGLATNSYAWTHPSLPNYLDLVSGSTQGISSDCSTCTANGTQLVDQLQQKGIGWQAFIESMPSPCFTGDAPPPYDRNHNPFVYAPHLVQDPAECDRVVPLTRLGHELSTGTAPPFLWVTPNVQHDMHTGSVREGDTWLSHELPTVLSSSWYRAAGTVIITFDEGETNAGCCGGAAGGHIMTLVISAATAGGARMTAPVDHAGVLRTIETLYGVRPLGAAADPASGSLLPLLGKGAS